MPQAATYRLAFRTVRLRAGAFFTVRLAALFRAAVLRAGAFLAVRLAAVEIPLDDAQLDDVAAACWRAVSRG